LHLFYLTHKIEQVNTIRSEMCNMEAKLLNPIVSSLSESISMFTGVGPEKESVNLLNDSVPSNTDTHVFIGITGDLYGTVLLSAKKENALKLASSMAGMELSDFDDISISALKELCNMVVGGAVTRYSQMGLDSEITPPTFLEGNNLNIRASYPLVSVNFTLSDINFYINLSVKQKKSKTVLVVDDATFVRKQVVDVLSQDDYHIVGECQNGLECIEFIKKSGQPDIVLLDITMPEMDGLQTLEQLKKDYPHLKVVMVTALGQQETMQKATTLGADGYVVKPFEKERLLDVLKKV